MSRLLAARVAKLEAAKRIPARVLGVSVDGTPMWREAMRDGVLYCLPRYEHEEWAESCRQQQNQLMAELAGYAALLDEAEPQADAPAIVGTVKDKPAPWPANRKRPKFVEVAGKEIEIATFVGFTR